MIYYGSSTEIPDDLVLAHEEGKVVFFCGAGISYDAGIPLFKDLVSETALNANIQLGKEELSLLENGDCDVVFQEMERRVDSEKRTWLRGFTSKLLTPRNDLSDDDLSYHSALLKLSVARNTEKLHLVTTNYDPLFDKAYKLLRSKKEFNKKLFAYAAPLLPIPKKHKWDGIIYLHGKLQHGSSDDNLNSLIISSGDFGVAYLTERWASRFVVELFREYTICFVGYSVNDTIMRYMVDALAADKLLGEEQRPVYAFDGYEGDCRDFLVEQWEKKGINVIPFKKGCKDDYSELKHTLTAWSDFYSAGLSGPVRIILDEAPNKPDTMSPDGQSAIKRVIWALRRDDMLPIIKFATLEPPPPLEWFDVILDEQTETLNPSKASFKGDRCLPKKLLPLCFDDNANDYLKQMLTWLSKHLHDPMLLARLCKITKPLSPYVISFLENAILDSKEQTAPRRMSEPLRKLWLLWLESNRTTRMDIADTRIYPWIPMINQIDKSLGVELAFAEFIRPSLHLMPRNTFTNSSNPKDLRTNFTWEYCIIADDMHVRTLESYGLKLGDIPTSAFPVIETALVQLCKMRREMGDEQNENDRSEYYIQDISGPIDDKNKIDRTEWCILVFLMRSMWDQLLTANTQEATRIAHNWFDSPHPLFKRLALYAVTKNVDLDPNEAVMWLLLKPKERLFGNTYCREILNLLSACGKRLSQQTLDSLDKRLKKYPEGMARERRALFLERLQESSVELPKTAEVFLNQYREKHPDWTMRNKKYDGLSFWISDGSDKDWLERSTAGQTAMPEDDKAILDWLKEYERFQILDTRNDPWRKFCRDKFGRACKILSNEDLINAVHNKAWNGLLIEACKKENVLTLFDSIPKDKVVVWARESKPVDVNFASVAEWFRLLSGCDVDVKTYLDIADALLSHQTSSVRQIEPEVIMEGVLRRWYETKPSAVSKILSPFVEFFGSVIRGESEALRLARNELLTQLSNLALVDKEWTLKTIVPSLSWDTPEAIEFWRSAIKMSWLNWDLLRQIKTDFIRAATHFKDLESSGEWYANVFVVMATSKNVGYGIETYSKIIRLLPNEGRQAVANRIGDMLHNAGGKIDVYWKEEIRPFVKTVWPPDKSCMSPKIAGSLFSGIAYCNETFPDASRTLLDLHRGKVELSDVAFRLATPPQGTESRCRRYPDEVLDILSRVDTEKENNAVALWIEKCLAMIKSIPNGGHNGTYENDGRYVNLMAYVQRNRH